MSIPKLQSAKPDARSSRLKTRFIGDFEEISRIFGQWDGRIEQISRGEFQGSAGIYPGTIVRAFRVETNQSLLTRGVDNADFATIIPITPRNEGVLWRGRRLSPGQITIKGPKVEYYNQTARGSIISGLLVPMPVLRQAAEQLGEFEIGDRLSSSKSLSPAPDKMHRFQQNLLRLLNPSCNVRESTVFSHRETEQECLRWLIACLAGASQLERLEVDRRQRLTLINRALEYMHASLDRPVTAQELCVLLGVNDRALRRLFKEFFGVGPVAYSRLLRLHAVRSHLKRAHGTGATVAEIAPRCGFNRLGAFARLYRTQFGELPSETLGVRGWPGIQQMTREREPHPAKH